MSPLKSFLLGIAVATTASILAILNIPRHTTIVDELLSLPEKDLLARSEEIRHLDGGEGKALLALLACIGLKGRALEQVKACENAAPVATAAKSSQEQGKRLDDPRLVAAPPAPAPAPAAESAAASKSSTSGVSAPPYDSRSFFCHAARGTPQRVDEEKWLALYKADPGVNAEAARAGPQGFGVPDGEVADVSTLLEDRQCPAPVLWTMTPERRQNLLFFRETRGRVYEGPVTFFAASSMKRPLRMHIHFNPATGEADREYWTVFDNAGRKPEDVYETRYASYGGAHPVWRVNACSGAVTILGDFCAWAGIEYDLELKDLFHLQGVDGLAGNIYCRKKKDKTWLRMGKLELKRASG